MVGVFVLRQVGTPPVTQQAYIQADQIKIRDQVKFATASAAIVPGKDSQDVLDAVEKILQQHPEIKEVRVEGHTDSTGAAAFNRTLSQHRAESVVKWLVKHGIDASRLGAQGFGPERPIDDNAIGHQTFAATCQSLPAPGERCNYQPILVSISPSCAPYARCDTGSMCRPLGEVDAFCDDDEQCYTGFCDRSRCARAHACP